MNVAPPFSTGATNAPDPRLQPTPDYGTSGPGSDIAGLARGQESVAQRKSASPFAHVFAALVGMVAALVVGMLSNKHAIRPKLPSSNLRQAASAKDQHQLDRMKPQKQAETLLELRSRIHRNSGTLRPSIPTALQLAVVQDSPPRLQSQQKPKDCSKAATGSGTPSYD